MTTYEASKKGRDYMKARLGQPLTVVSIEEMLVVLKELGSADPEVAHSYEDQLYEVVLRQLDDPIAEAALKTKGIKFPRWFA